MTRSQDIACTVAKLFFLGLLYLLFFAVVAGIFCSIVYGAVWLFAYEKYEILFAIVGAAWILSIIFNSKG